MHDGHPQLDMLKIECLIFFKKKNERTKEERKEGWDQFLPFSCLTYSSIKGRLGGLGRDLRLLGWSPSRTPWSVGGLLVPLLWLVPLLFFLFLPLGPACTLSLSQTNKMLKKNILPLYGLPCFVWFLLLPTSLDSFFIILSHSLFSIPKSPDFFPPRYNQFIPFWAVVEAFPFYFPSFSYGLILHIILACKGCSINMCCMNDIQCNSRFHLPKWDIHINFL